MKGKRGLREAIDLLYSRGNANADTYTRLVLDCFRYNDVHQAKRLQSHMDLHFYEPSNTFIHNRLLHVYTRSGKLRDAQKLFEKMPKRDIYSYNAMLLVYSKLGYADDLCEFFEQMPDYDTVSYNTFIAGMASSGYERMALEVFLRMQRNGFELTEHTHVSILNACSKLLNLKLGRQIHGRIVVCGLRVNVFIHNGLIDMYAKCGEIDKARWLFDQIVHKNLIAWNLMISGYLKNGQPEKCLHLYHKMRSFGVKPDSVTVSEVLSAFFLTGNTSEAHKTFREFEEKDLVCWTTMIVGYGQNGHEEKALMLFSDMLSENIRPDSYTVSSVVSSCAKLASLYHGQAVHGKTVHLGIDGNLSVSSAIVDMYSKCGETADAWIVFNLMPVKNVVTWNSMIVGYAQNGKDTEALALYEEMLQENLKPNDITFVGILSACIHGGFIAQGQQYFHSIRDQHGMTPTLDHYSCMISLIGRSDQLDKAVNLINEMPHEPNILFWSTLLSACAMNGDIKYAEMAAKHLFELDQFNAGPYITLCNMYAARGRWKDAASIRSLMKGRDIKKFAAYSWIEVDGKINKFVSEDHTHPEMEIICQELSRLIAELHESGFTRATSLVLPNMRENEELDSMYSHREKLALAVGSM